jgi:hypothetical protein
MSLLEVIKGFLGGDGPKLKAISHLRLSKLINVNIKIDRSVHIHGPASAATVTVDPERLDAKKHKALQQALRDDGLPEAGAILEEKSTPQIDQILKALPSHEDIAKKLTPIIPAADHSLLLACLFMRRRMQAGEPVEEQKAEIGRIYGTRGRNFSNLCSAGYLETWCFPLYEELLKANPGQPEVAKAQFQAHYNQTLVDLPWTEFVSSHQSADQITEHVVGKMRRNILNGIRHFDIHAFGSGNVSKAIKSIPAIRKATGAAIAKGEQTPTRIYVRLEIPRAEATIAK